MNCVCASLSQTYHGIQSVLPPTFTILSLHYHSPPRKVHREELYWDIRMWASQVHRCALLDSVLWFSNLAPACQILKLFWRVESQLNQVLRKMLTLIQESFCYCILLFLAIFFKFMNNWISLYNITWVTCKAFLVGSFFWERLQQKPQVCICYFYSWASHTSFHATQH